MSEEPTYHKMITKKVNPGYNPDQPLCDSDETFVYMARDWKDVDCEKCLKLKSEGEQ